MVPAEPFISMFSTYAKIKWVQQSNHNSHANG